MAYLMSSMAVQPTLEQLQPARSRLDRPASEDAWSRFLLGLSRRSSEQP
jgi:hypothetical protein